MEKEIVISHYAEDLAWIPTVAGRIPVRIYSKGPNPPKGAEKLPNVGFEAHTWLHHFAARYDELADVTVCLQGHPHDHWREDESQIIRAIHGINPADFAFRPLTRFKHGKFQIRPAKPLAYIAADTRKLWPAIMGHVAPDFWWSWYAGMFAVHRDLVRARPREFWQRAAALIQTKDQACVMERMWGHLFA